ncbi:class II aldolase/adducin family protein [Coprothermobacter platensis]|uniref:class II aldolase/adducin family protein n=1 Tax=Coprothermobacter platensis TaxID=108819 RepID=UPI00037B4780|nr:class II aldolase/adducin family protein [Coprothermobacter platensis]
MDQKEQLLRQSLADIMKKLYSRGLISVYGGNASALLDDNSALFITPSGFNKENLTKEDLVKVDFRSGLALGDGKPSSELKTHMSVYGTNSAVRAVVHAHPTTLVGLCTAGHNFGVYTPEQAILVGKPAVIDFCMGEELAKQASSLCLIYSAVVVKNHGVFAWGSSIMEAYAKIEILEEAAKMVLAGFSVPGMNAFDEQMLEAVRKNYKPGR